MCVYDTEENQRSEYTNKTLQSLAQRVDFRKHRLIVVDNNSCQKAKDIIRYWQNIIDKYRNGELDVYYEDKI